MTTFERMDPMNAEASIPPWLRQFPGVVLRLDPEGVILDSNGCLETALGHPVVGRRFADLLDQGPSRTKWTRMVGGEQGVVPRSGWELILCAGDTVLDPRRFTLLRDEPTGGWWVMEHPGDPGVDSARVAVMEVNTELVETQRELVREQHRLSAVLRDLERSNRALDEFAHAVSHDLRAPLRSIAYYAKWIEEDAQPALGGDARAHLEKIQAQAGRMQAMIEGVLQYARAGRLRSQAEVVHLDVLVDDVVQFLAPPPSVRIRADGPLPTLVTERAPLQQVLLNLVANAVTHGGEGVQVAITAEDRGREIEVAVADDGPGIPPLMRDRIWELFHTGATGAKGGGTGIGLAVVRRLVEDRGGRAWVAESSGPGTTFRFTWPKESNREIQRGE